MDNVLAGDPKLAIDFAQHLWDNVRLIFFDYRTYAVWYIIVTGYIGFAFVYRFGPATDKRSQNLVTWGLQLVAMGLIYYSSYYREASVGGILWTIGMYNFPMNWLCTVCGKFW